MISGSGGVSVLIGTFTTVSVEVTEMVIIVVGAGATRGWRSTWVGVAAGLTVLVAIIVALGQALSLIPIDIVRIVIGGLLLTFGLQWYCKGVIQVAADGLSGGAEEEEIAGDEGTRGRIDWTAHRRVVSPPGGPRGVSGGAAQGCRGRSRASAPGQAARPGRVASSSPVGLSAQPMASA
jgi:hypothetical protein